MTCDDARQRLPWLVGGRLDEAEARELDRHLAVCASCRTELAETRLAGALFATHPSSDDLVAHAWDDLPAEARPGIEGHLATCSDCRGELALLTESRRAMATAPRATGHRPGVPWTALAAALLLAALAAGGWAWTWQRLERSDEERRRLAIAGQPAGETPVPSSPAIADPPPTEPAPSPAARPPEDERLHDRVAVLEREVAGLRRPQAGVPVFELVAEEMALRGDRETPVPLASEPSFLVLLAEGIVAGEDYRVRIAPAGAPDWEGRALATVPGELTLHLPGAGLPPGRHRLSVLDSRRQLVASFDLQLR